jgi:hypothetical protein
VVLLEAVFIMQWIGMTYNHKPGVAIDYEGRHPIPGLFIAGTGLIKFDEVAGFIDRSF